jgi:hypothetical protein
VSRAEKFHHKSHKPWRPPAAAPRPSQHLSRPLGASGGREPRKPVAWSRVRSYTAILFATALGVPVSTTQTIKGAIVGAGAARKVTGCPLDVASDAVEVWVLTMPAAILLRWAPV